METSTQIWAATSDESVWLRVDGRGMADICPSLRSWCESHLTDERKVLHIQLSGCDHFDSTFLGTLLCLQKLHGRPGGDSVVLAGPSRSCLEALRRMGAHRLFPIEDISPPADLDWVLVCSEAADRKSDDFQRQVVDAHSQLAALPGPLGELYGPIARMAEQEFATRRSAAPRC